MSKDKGSSQQPGAITFEPLNPEPLNLNSETWSSLIITANPAASERHALCSMLTLAIGLSDAELIQCNNPLTNIGRAFDH